MRNQQTLRDVFKDRKHILLGLTKLETISLYKKIKYKTILSWDKNKIDQAWHEIGYIKRILRKEGIMAIISKTLTRGNILRDSINGFGNRELDATKFIYFRCSTLEDAWTVRNRNDKIAKGFIEAGNQVEELTKELQKERQIATVLNSPTRN